MSENDSSQERTEQPTPKRLREAREKGQVARSRELTMTLVMIAGAGTLIILGPALAGAASEILTDAFRIDRRLMFDEQALGAQFSKVAIAVLQLLTPFFMILVVVAVAGSGLIGGWNFSVKAVAPKMDKLSPIKGFKRIFGPKGLMELAKALAKFAVVGGVGLLLLWAFRDRVAALAGLHPIAAMSESVGLLLIGLLSISASLILIAAVDVPFQLHTHHKQLRMTRKELRDEYKETDGRPEVKQRIRALQQELAGRRMMEKVADADVVVMNPTHYAVALRYDAQAMAAPVVVAKGVDRIATEIRRRAEEARVPILRAPPLARALYAGVDLGQPIPAGLYVAVAEVLTWVYQVRNLPSDAPVPEPPNPPVSADGNTTRA